MYNEGICRRRNRENMLVLYTGIVKSAYKQFLIAIMRLPVYDDTESELKRKEAGYAIQNIEGYGSAIK